MSPTDSQPSILIADDESHIVHVVSLKLRNAGYRVLTARDGEEALEVALRERPDLVVTDYQMPYMTGLEVSIKLKEHEATKSVPILMLTARGFSLEGEDLERTNIADVVSKPFSPREVLNRVQQMIEPEATSVS